MAELISAHKLELDNQNQWNTRQVNGRHEGPISYDQSGDICSISANMERNTQATIILRDTERGLDNSVVNIDPQNVEFKRQQPLTLTWKNIIWSTKQGKTILKGVNGNAHTGELTAIIGPSGAGKTTLLNVLAGFASKSVSGEVFLNGEKRNNSFRKICCYVTQDDHLLAYLTVKESIDLAASLKIACSVPNEERQKAVNEILTTLRLTGVQNTRASKLSGGERKRLCIAQELISNPPIIFLDEPTSGLDSSSCFQCIKLLKSLAQEGRMVVCTIHQPSAKIFEIFDKVYLVAEGQCIYRGSNENLVPFFAQQGLICPPYHNPADFAMEVMVGEHGDWNRRLKEATKGLVDENDSEWPIAGIQNGDHMNKAVTFEASTLSLLPIKEREKPELLKETTRNYNNFATSFWTQFRILTYRGAICSLRNPLIFHLQLASQILSALFLGALYYGIGNNGSKIFDNAGFLFFAVMFALMSSRMPPVLTFAMEKQVIIREHLNSWYSVKAYYLAKCIVEIPLQVLFPVIFCSIAYWITFQPTSSLRFILFTLSTISISLVGQADGALSSAMFKDVQGAVYSATVVSMVILMFSGFMVRESTIPVFLRWLTYVSYGRYVYQGVLYSIYGMDREEFECSDKFCYFSEPKDILEFFEVYDSYLPMYFGIPVLFYLLFRILGYYGIKHQLESSDR